ncbi:MAG: ABC transporter transmembrane domain-containing protein [Nodosilinea sp.]
MNTGIAITSSSPDIWDGNSKHTLGLAALLSTLDQAQVRELQAIARLERYSLADEIASQRMRDLESNGSVGSNPHANDVFIVVEGQVRLLCPGIGEVRDSSLQRLQPGAMFGGDTHWIEDPLPYRATAASSDVCVLRIAAEHCHRLLKLPLQDSWRQSTQQRDCMIFFRSLTDLTFTSNHHLQQWVAHISAVAVPAGGRLSNYLSEEAGPGWLRCGEIADQSSTTLVAPGNGSFHPISAGNWVALTACRVYQVSQVGWERYSNLGLAPSHGNGNKVSQLLGPAEGSLPRPTLLSTSPASLNSSARGDSAVAEEYSENRVAFPKPIKRHILDRFHRYPWVEQQSSSDCGAACLSMIARYWGKRFPLNILRERANVGRSGASLKSLGQAAEGLGFQARPVRASLSRMADQKNPWIAHWEGNHFVVIYSIKGSEVVMADPAIGRKTVSRQEFKQRWTGFALLLEPTLQLQETELKQVSLGRYMAALTPHRSVIVQVILVSLLIQVFGLVSPLFTQIILDRVVVQKSMSTLNLFAVGLVLFSIWSICLSSVRQYLLSYFSNRLDLTLISGFINHTLTLPLKFFESRRVGDIITRVQENQKIQRFLIGQVVLAWLNFLTGFVYLGLMLYYNWQLTLLVLGLIPPIVILTLGATPFLRKLSRELFKEAADQNSTLVEMMNGIGTVKSVAAERDLRWLWEDKLTRQMNVRFQGQKLGIGLGATNGLINSIGGAILLWFGASLVIRDQLTIGQFVAFNMMMGYVISPVLALANLWDELQEVLISVERLNDVFETEPEESAQNPMLVLPRIEGDVVFEDVTFRYGPDEDRNTLQNLTFHGLTGQTIAIVGRSGSGKTTLVKLLEGLYHPVSGRVLIDGHDVRHISPQSLRSQLGVVPQDCFLFSGTILENITLFRPEFTLEDAVEAAKLAEAHSFIQSLPLGYNTKVGERGSTLSGGQRQRIAIARALLGRPAILLLDEATSSLDTESERRFQQNLAQISRDRTTFIIAHRLSTVRNADQILVIDRGVLVEQGTHSELIQLQGLYCHLAQQQLDL